MSHGRRDRSAIVLAGGLSRRFGRDKLAEPLRGRPMLDHAVLSVASIASEVLVAGSAGPATLPEPPGTAIRRIPDAHPGAGPLTALATALATVRHGVVIVVGGDMPDLAPPVLELLASRVERSGTQAAVLAADGRPRPLPVALAAAAAAQASRAALDAGESSLRAMLDRLATETVAEPAWRALDVNGLTVRDVDVAADLEGTERRPRSWRASCGR